ncbi:class II fructose-bisphosphate aldolase [Parageobacillus sp. KH3-4]|uniref:class II fructose-bisphosphate aldolase n=1 Tax=Parageobacillus sp. KH3-4 TaxID=2916802 RepID=UPI001FCA7D8D|nr:class II fructose-bisphosphate aldolase [Parageobacillus sp. KH3-4]BDG47253.1 fructose-bisphosphate aldolase [Parageobacillus sp. KH3-4]
MENILAININDMIDVQAIVESSINVKDPIIFNVSKAAIKFAGLEYLVSLFEVAKKKKPNILLQLDHATELDYIQKCVEMAPFDIVMADGSKKDLEENIKFTKQVVELGKKIGFQVEGEIGIVPDSLQEWNETCYTNVEDAKYFVQETDVDYLAVSVGNVHGFGEKQKLNQALIKELSKATGKPLVLHGADFLNDEELIQAMKNGIRKINIGPDIRVPYYDTLVNFKGHSNVDHRKALLDAKEAMKRVLEHKLKIVYRGEKISI